MMNAFILKGTPAILLRKERFVVVGDLHIGKNLELERLGMHVPGATLRMAASLLELAKRSRSKAVVLAGDVKHSLSYPSREEFMELSAFFYALRSLHVVITKGNHDPHLDEAIKRMGSDAEVVRELILDETAIMHGHALPSEEAMSKKLLVTAHSHPAVEVNGSMEKAFIFAKISKGAKAMYPSCRKDADMVVLPSYNNLITGTNVSEAATFTPLFRNRIFDINGAKVYLLSKKMVGTVSSLR